MRRGLLDFIVGLFILVGIIALVFLAFGVSGLTHYTSSDFYTVRASFDNVGDLKVRAPVTIAGVRVGQVSAIYLNPVTFQATVRMQINKREDKITDDTAASILTAGILGSNYIGLTPGYEEKVLQNNSEITTTHSALILENLIGQFLFNMKK